VSSRGVLIIAEAGVNHDGSLDRALQLVDAAADAGADAVKFQTFRAESLARRDAPKARYQVATTGAAESQYDMLRRLELDGSAHQTLLARCVERGIEFLSTPFDPESLVVLSRLGVGRLKLSSGDLTNSPLLVQAARTQLPVILSTGMGTLGEIETALAVLAFGYCEPEGQPSEPSLERWYASEEGRRVLQARVTLLHCTTEYPAPLADVNLRTMGTLRAAFGLPVGYSDHTQGIAVPIAAAALGAEVVEKHFTLDRTLPGPDHRASLEPAELAAMVRAIRDVETALGTPLKAPAASERGNRVVARKSLVASRDIRKGEAFTTENLGSKRPGDGVSPARYWEWLGRIASRDYRRDEQVEP
jgi:N-acetylneuraminate synthase